MGTYFEDDLNTGGRDGPPLPAGPKVYNSTNASIMSKYIIYEGKTKFYILATDSREDNFRIIEVDLTCKTVLNLKEDPTVYAGQEAAQHLALEEKTQGKITKRVVSYGIVGFIRFTDCYYISCITRRSPVALLGGKYIYHIDATELIPVWSSFSYKRPKRNSEEARFLATLQNLNIEKTFYFSYSYDITHSLQKNILRERDILANPKIRDTSVVYNEMFVWNHHLLKPIIKAGPFSFNWCLPIIHGFIDQADISVFGRDIFVTIIARRSHYFAGARFLKRGVNNQGYVANNVETEQIVCDMLTTSFHDAATGPYNNPRYTSFIQHRGSIPLYWTQDVTSMSPKPPIELNVVDPFFSSAALHFDDMFERYGTPIMVLNLIKTRERNPRETLLLHEFEQCIHYLNQFLPKNALIQYTSWDMSRAAKGRGHEVIDYLERYADRVLKTTGFFHNGTKAPMLQSGVCRTNCIDCLDRTNAAQFVIGKRALATQLHALGVIDKESLEYDNSAVNLLTEMYHDHGDTIALQYGGSHLVNTMETYRKLNQWTSHSRDLIESIRRYYSNSFVDSQRQEAINLFLGNYVWEKGKPMLWDLATDYYLHQTASTIQSNPFHRNYIHWWTPKNLCPLPDPHESALMIKPLDFARVPADAYWREYYKPRSLSSLRHVFAFGVNSTLRYISYKSGENYTSLSPFIVRKPVEEFRHRDAIVKDIAGEEIKEEKDDEDKEDEEEDEDEEDQRDGIIKRVTGPDRKSLLSPLRARSRKRRLPFRRIKAIRQHLPTVNEKSETLSDGTLDMNSRQKMGHRAAQSGKSGGKRQSQFALPLAPLSVEAILPSLTHPTVSEEEMHEYQRYIDYPSSLPLVTRDPYRIHQIHPEYERYVNQGLDTVSQGSGLSSKASQEAPRTVVNGALNTPISTQSLPSGTLDQHHASQGSRLHSSLDEISSNGGPSINSNITADTYAHYLKGYQSFQETFIGANPDASEAPKKVKAYQNWVHGAGLGIARLRV